MVLRLSNELLGLNEEYHTLLKDCRVRTREEQIVHLNKIDDIASKMQEVREKIQQCTDIIPRSKSIYL